MFILKFSGFINDLKTLAQKHYLYIGHETSFRNVSDGCLSNIFQTLLLVSECSHDGMFP